MEAPSLLFWVQSGISGSSFETTTVDDGRFAVIGKNLSAVLKRGVLSLTLATMMCIGTSTTASAQSGAAGFAEMNIHDYLHRDVVLFAQALEMDEGQRVIVESLYEDYRSMFDAGWARTQQRFSDMREDLQSADRDQIMNLVLAPFEDWQREKARLKQQFEQNVRVILNPMQLERWPAFERQMLREKTMHYGRLSGESLNLFHVLRDLRMSDRDRMRIDPTMEQYDLALHHALEQRNATLRESQNAAMRSIRNPEQVNSISRIRQEVERRIAIRNINDQFIDVIAGVLPEQYVDEFRRNALERAYPRVFRPLPAERVLEEAAKLVGLDDEKRSRIESMRVAMADDFATINARLHQGIRSHEPNAMINQAEIAAARQTGDDVTRLADPNIEHIRQRDERANYYMTQLRELLGTEQFATLPGSSRWVPQRRAESAEPQPARSLENQPRRGGQPRSRRGDAEAVPMQPESPPQ